MDIFSTDDVEKYSTDFYYDDIEETPTQEDLLDDIDMDALSVQAQETLLEYAVPIARGAYIDDLAEAHDVKPMHIRRRLSMLEKELRAAVPTYH